MILTAEKTANLLRVLAGYQPVEADEIDNAHANADDGGNFNDTLDHGIGLGERLLADEIRAAIGLT